MQSATDKTRHNTQLELDYASCTPAQAFDLFRHQIPTIQKKFSALVKMNVFSAGGDWWEKRFIDFARLSGTQVPKKRLELLWSSIWIAYSMKFARIGDLATGPPSQEITVIDHKSENGGRVNYPGSKSTGHVYKKIINQFKWHSDFISGFLGNCTVMKNKKPAPGKNIGIEITGSVITKHWSKSPHTILQLDFIKHIIQGNTKGVSPDLFNAIQLIRRLLTYDKTLLYLDPPYLLRSRRSGALIYENELTDEQHEIFLQWVKTLKCMVVISHYPCPLYDEQLKDWRKITYQVKTHRGMVEECIYLNYPEPTELHEYTYLGDNSDERQRIKRLIQRALKRLNLEGMPPLRRNAMIEAIKEKVKTL